MQARDREQRFDAIYAEHRDTLFAYFLGRTSDREQALDLLQELFLRVWRSLQSVESLPASKRRFWLFSVARNLVVDHYRAATARQRVQAALDPPEEREPAADVAVLADEQVRLLDAALRRLPEDLRMVLVVQVLGEQTSTSIGELLGRPAGTVRYQLVEARRRLSRDLQLIEYLSRDRAR